MRDWKGIIFDLDGVLLSTDHFHYLAWKALADRLGIPFDEKKNDLLRGVSRMDSLEIILGERSDEFSPEEKLAFATEKNLTYRSYLQTLTPEFVSPEVPETLQKLRDSGLRLAVGSSSKNTPLILEKTDLRKYFDAVSDGNNITKSKPDPEVFLKAAQFIGLDPSECVVVEDADSGIEAAKRGGFYAISIGDSVTNGLDDRHINSLVELL
ncbi:MAG: beta-phosphoglucomutase [Spirochaetales bacterium]|nr:beta-phosphoglucomutase [Spirochaetales bacterium]